MRFAFSIAITLFFSYACIGQYEKKTLRASTISIAPKIDGLLDDLCWGNVSPASGFVMDKPTPGISLEQGTEVKIVYDNEAIYVGFVCYDTAPDSILQQLSGRDQSGNSDFCAVTFSCYRDGINGFTFGVSPKAEQWDARHSAAIAEDVSWNAVWYCRTKISADGWTAEFKIPFAAIRFPDLPEQLWDINFARTIRRNRHHAYWNGVDPLVPGVLTQMGTLTDVAGIKPPRRIFFLPYASTYFNTSKNADGSTNSDLSYNVGMDAKIGLSDAFTLDAALIPDFGQTIQDQQVLNLSAYELQFSENRQFFTEGTELFSKAGIFYSRRVGFEKPMHYNSVKNNLNDDEKILDNPSKDHVVNAIKISGRNRNNLGVGFFNAVTNSSYALIQNTENGATRKIKTSPLTNYNVFVLDQNLPHNSYISLINTNVLRAGDDYDVNLTGTEFDLRNKRNTFSITGSGVVSDKFNQNAASKEDVVGFRHGLNLNKISGNWTWSTGYAVKTNTYDPNDLGFVQANNSVVYNLTTAYNIYKPFGKFNSFWSEINSVYSNLYLPYTFTNLNVNGNVGITTRGFHTWSIEYDGSPVRGYDYFEPRVWGRVFRTYTYNTLGTWYSSDYRKKIALDASVFYSDYENAGRYKFNFRIAPRLRFNDHLFVTYVYSYQSHINDVGFAYAYEDDATSQPLFGIRDVISHTNVLNVQYAFNRIMTLSGRVRHYWGYSKYSSYKSLTEDGYLSSTEASGTDQSFNSFTIDLIYRWIFTPGSEISVVWKNAIIDFDDKVPATFSEDFNYNINLPQVNSVSVKFIYFLDYRAVAKAVSKKVS